MSAADGQPIFCHGEACIEINIPCLRRKFLWNFIIANTTHPLLGADFLTHHHIIVDCKSKTIMDGMTKLAITTKESAVSEVLQISVNSNMQVSSKVDMLLKEFPSVISPKKYDSSPCCTKIKHTIDTGNANLTYAKARQLAPDKLETVKQEFKLLQKSGIIRPSKFPWTSPLHMVPKKTPGLCVEALWGLQILECSDKA